MKKKLLLAVAMIAMLVCILTISVSASSYDTTRKVTLDNGTEVALYDNDGYALTYYLNDSGALTSAKTIDVISVNGNGVATYNGVAVMKVVVANYQSTEIEALNIKQLPVYYYGSNGGGYHSYNDVIEYVYTPSTLTTLLLNQFRCTSKLKIVDIPNDSKISSFGQYVFYYAQALKTINIPANLETTPGGANDGKNGTAAVFSYCTSLETITFAPNCKLKSFGTSCFKGCTSLKEVTLPDSFTTLNANVFENCENLEAIRLGANLESSTGVSPFRFCYNLTRYYISSSFTSLNQHTFTNDSYSAKVPKNQVFFFTGTLDQLNNFITAANNAKNNPNLTSSYTDATKNGRVLAWNPANADSYYQNLATTANEGAGATYYVYGYNTCNAFYNGIHAEVAEDNNPCWLTECSNCGLSATYVGNDDTHSFVYSITYNGYFGNKGDKLATCQNENCIYHNTPKTEKEAVNAIISSFKGFSVSEDGDGLTFGYTIDYDALDAYVKTNGNDVELGFVIALQKNSGDNAPDINASTSITAKVVNWTTSDEENAGVAKYVGADFKVVGNWAGHEDVVFCMAGYLNDGKTVSYLNYESSSEKADTFYIAQFMN